jgi:hypothetical protein
LNLEVLWKEALKSQNSVFRTCYEKPDVTLSLSSLHIEGALEYLAVAALLNMYSWLILHVSTSSLIIWHLFLAWKPNAGTCLLDF